MVLPPLLTGAASGGSLRNDWRRLEDKLAINCRVEIRQFVTNLDLSDVHKSRELPSAYVCWLGVPDSTLPHKGTAHRALRGKDADPPPEKINTFPYSIWNDIL